MKSILLNNPLLLQFLVVICFMYSQYNSIYAAELYTKGKQEELVSVDPDRAKQGEKLEVTIIGTGTKFCTYQGTSVINNVSNIYISKDTFTVSALSWNPGDETNVDAIFSVPVATPPGSYAISVEQMPNSDVVSMEDGFTITDEPTIYAIDPSGACLEETVTVNMYGKNTDFSEKNVQCVYLQNKNIVIPAHSFYPISKTHLAVTFTLTPQTNTGRFHAKVIQKSTGDTASYWNMSGFTIGIIDSPRVYFARPEYAEFNEHFTTHIYGINTEFYTIVNNSNVLNVSKVYLKKNNIIINGTSIGFVNRTELYADFTIPDNSPEGYYDICVTYKNGNEPMPYKNGILIKKKLEPRIINIGNMFAEQGGNRESYISGEETKFMIYEGSEKKENIESLYIHRLDDTIIPYYINTGNTGRGITIQFNVPDTVSPGYYTLTIIQKSNTDTISFENAWYIIEKGKPTVRGIAPDNTRQGTDSLPVTIFGANTTFLIQQGSDIVNNVGAAILMQGVSSIPAKLINHPEYPTKFTAVFDIPYNTPTGLYTVLVEQKSGSPLAHRDSAFYIHDAQPLLKSPYDKEYAIDFDPTFIWYAFHEAKEYHIQISSYSNFSNIVVDTQHVNDTAITCNTLSSNTFYYWRVKAITPDIITPWSDIWGFNTGMVFYTVSASADSFGIITPNGTISVHERTDKKFDILADSGYCIKKITIDDTVIIDNIFDTVYTYTFKNITFDHTIHVKFQLANTPIIHTINNDKLKKPTEVFTVHPNPVNQSLENADFYFQTDNSCNAELTIYDALGNIVHTGSYTVTSRYMHQPFCRWNIKNRNNNKIAIGSYLAVLKTVTMDGTVAMYKTIVGIK